MCRCYHLGVQVSTESRLPWSSPIHRPVQTCCIHRHCTLHCTLHYTLHPLLHSAHYTAYFTALHTAHCTIQCSALLWLHYISRYVGRCHIEAVGAQESTGHCCFLNRLQSCTHNTIHIIIVKKGTPGFIHCLFKAASLATLNKQMPSSFATYDALSLVNQKVKLHLVWLHIGDICLALVNSW